MVPASAPNKASRRRDGGIRRSFPPGESRVTGSGDAADRHDALSAAFNHGVYGRCVNHRSRVDLGDLIPISLNPVAIHIFIDRLNSGDPLAVRSGCDLLTWAQIFDAITLRVGWLPWPGAELGLLALGHQPDHLSARPQQPMNELAHPQGRLGKAEGF